MVMLFGACALLGPVEGAAPTAGSDVPHAVLHFHVTDTRGADCPARLTFIGDGGPNATLFPNTAAAPDDLAVRRNLIYSKTGRGAVTVPVGRYTVWASRGLEWSVASATLELLPGGVATWNPTLRHEVDTTGWISGDFHLHTLTHSGHGDANLEERVITFLGEGLEFAVATDHNHHTDYAPIVSRLGVRGLATVVGNEVTVPIGHFNAFPLDPQRPVAPVDAGDAVALFKLLRAEPNPTGVVPVIQVNHPRWEHIDYFGQLGLDAVTATTADPRYSADFDSIEVFNENTGWGYYDAERTDQAVGSGRHSVLQDWFNLLNRGHRYAAVGNSDSHTVHDVLAGYPRNFVRSSTDDPERIDVAEVASAIRHRQVFTTIGPFVTYTVDGVGMGGDVATTTGQVTLTVRVQAASWVDCDR